LALVGAGWRWSAVVGGGRRWSGLFWVIEINLGA
jgi:hypothetical protein